MATLYRWWAALVVLLVVVQVGLAGYGAFDSAKNAEDDVLNSDKFEDSFGPHAGLGYLVVLSTLVLLILAALARRDPRVRLRHSAILFGLLILQVLLAWFGAAAPAIGFFHPVNALAIFALSGYIASTAWRSDRVATTVPAP